MTIKNENLLLKVEPNLTDSSGSGNTITNSGTTLTTDRFGRQNMARSFNGTINHISLGTTQIFPNQGSAWTYSVWSKPTITITDSSNYVVLGSFNTNLNGNAFNLVKGYGYPTTGSVAFGHRTLNSADGNLSVRYDINYDTVLKDRFCLYTFVYTGGTISSGSSYKFYLNGVEQTQTGVVRIGGNSTTNYIGVDTALQSISRFGGTQHSNKVWNIALTTEEVQADYADAKESLKAGVDWHYGGYIL